MGAVLISQIFLKLSFDVKSYKSITVHVYFKFQLRFVNIQGSIIIILKKDLK